MTRTVSVVGARRERRTVSVRRVVTAVSVALGSVLIAIGAYASERPGECVGRHRLPALSADINGLPSPEYGCTARDGTAFTVVAFAFATEAFEYVR